MSNPNPNTSNLIPVKKGERRAAKEDSLKVTERIAIQLRPSDKEDLVAKHGKNISKHIRSLLGLDY